ncbi:cytochrome P450 [Ramaria rubella]|nr:cytochrome P450 [Ramaria rubella]
MLRAEGLRGWKEVEYSPGDLWAFEGFKAANVLYGLKPYATALQGFRVTESLRGQALTWRLLDILGLQGCERSTDLVETEALRQRSFRGSEAPDFRRKSGPEPRTSGSYRPQFHAGSLELEMSFQIFVLERPYMASFILCLVFLFVYTAFNRLHGSRLPRAPRVKYFLPWIGSAIQMGKNPDAFLKRASLDLGPIFRIQAAGKEMAWSFEYLPVRLDIIERAFGLPRDLMHTRFFVDDLLQIHHEELSPKKISDLIESYAKNAHTYLSQALEKFDGTCTELMSFILLPAYLAAAATFFGTAFEAEKSYKGFKAFDDQFHLIVVAGLPKFMFRGAFRAWEEVIDLLEQYLKTPHEDSSTLMLRMESSAKGAGWRSLGTTIKFHLRSILGHCTDVLQQPEGLAALIAEVDQARVDWKTQHPDHLSYENQHQWVLDVTLPHLISAIQEALRFASSSFSQRRVSKPTDFGGFHFEPGELIVCATRSVHIDDEIHPNPQEFDSKRKNGKIVPKHFLPFGGGISMCEGRHFVMGELKIFLALMMTCVTIELNPNSNARPKFITERMGAGIMHPSGDFSIKISKRKD